MSDLWCRRMTGSPPADPGIAPVYRDDPRLQPLIGPGAPFEVEAMVLDGVPLRDFVRAPRTIVDLFHMGAAHEALSTSSYEDERLTFADVRRQSRPGPRAAGDVRRAPRRPRRHRHAQPARVRGVVLGAALAGAIVVPLNAWWTGSELIYALRDAGVSVVFAGRRAARAGRRRRSACRGVASWPCGGPTAATSRSTSWWRARRWTTTPIARARPRRPGDDPLHVGHDRAPKGALGTNRGHGREPLEHGVRRRTRGRSSPDG